MPGNIYIRLSRNPDEPSDMTPEGPTEGDSSDGREQSDPSGLENRPLALLVELSEDPDRIRSRLPTVLGMLEADDPSVRLCAAWTCCLLAVEDESTVEYLLRRMVDRLDEHASPALTAALDYLSATYPDRVERTLAGVADAGSGLEPGSFTHSEYYDHTTRSVGRTIVRRPDGDDSHQGYVDGEELRERQSEGEHDQRGDTVEVEDATEPPEPTKSPETARRDRDTNADEDETFEGSPGTMLQRMTETSTIAVRSRFDEFHVRGERYRDRYATTYEALVGQGGSQRAIALRLLHRPENTEARPSFEAAIELRLERWRATSDHDHVLSVRDWGVVPRPWLATALVEDTLAERDRVDFVAALGQARGLAAALAHLHQNDVVHGAVDPENVVYPGEALDAAGTAPLLDNVGLIGVYRRYVAPERCLDPRYAAPEYYSSEFGQIDHATDIYQFGAVLYRLFTGRPPYTDDLEDLSRVIVERDPSAPSSVVEGVPERVDDLVSKAMATGKLHRYETVENLRGDLESIAEEYDYV